MNHRRFFFTGLAALVGVAALLALRAGGQVPADTAKGPPTIVEVGSDGKLIERTTDGKILPHHDERCQRSMGFPHLGRRPHVLCAAELRHRYPAGDTPHALDAESQKLMSQEQAAAQEARACRPRLSKLARTARRPTPKKKLREKLAQIFDLQQERRTREIAKIEERLGKLKETLKKRETSKDSIIDRRLETITGGVDELGWEESLPTHASPNYGYPTPGRQPMTSLPDPTPYPPPATAPVPPSAEPRFAPPPVAPRAGTPSRTGAELRIAPARPFPNCPHRRFRRAQPLQYHRLCPPRRRALVDLRNFHVPRPLQRRHVPGLVAQRLGQRHDVGLRSPAGAAGPQVDRRIDQQLRLAAVERAQGDDVDFHVPLAGQAQRRLSERPRTRESSPGRGPSGRAGAQSRKARGSTACCLPEARSSAMNCTAAALSLSIIRQENSVPSSVQSTLPG